MPSKPLIDVHQRRARLGGRHLLASSARAESSRQVAHSLVALHATDPATVFLAAAARMTQPSVGDMERSLYDDRVLVRLLGMRRTMFVVTDDMAPVVQAACTRGVAIQLRKRYTQLLEQTGVAQNGDSFMREVESATVAALEARREATAQQLGQDVPSLKTQVHLAEGKSYGGVQSIATWILNQLAADARIVRGRPRGTWVSSQYRWAPIDAWLRNGLADIPTPEAQARLISAWLGTFGPGTREDLKWWTGLTMGEVKRALSIIDLTEVDLGESTGLMLSDDLDAGASPEPWVALLPALDPTPMAYVQREWFLGNLATALFDRSGNIGPTVWSDGRIVGGWAQRKAGDVVYRLLEDVGRETESRVEAAAHELSRFLGTVRVTPRFRTPLERELSA